MSKDVAVNSNDRDPLIGRDIQGRYRILQRLGAGGMGTVYLGEHLMIKRKVAIKTLHAQFAVDPVVVQRFHREALAATSIGNEHIVEVTDMGHLADGALYMVLEHLDGSDLGQQIEAQGAQTLGRVTRIVLQLCEALGAVHDKGIVHRDLKPDNIFLISRGENPDFVKVLDFGISKFKTSLDDSGAKMTATGAALGTPYFMSPEQALGQPDVDHRADIYALGAIMYYALAGRHPFEATSLPALFMKICSEAPPALRSIRPDLPEAVEGVVHRALAREPGLRFSSTAELKEALLPFKDIEAAPPSDLQFDKTLFVSPSAAAPAASGLDDPAQASESLAGASHSVAAESVPVKRRGSTLVGGAIAGGVLLAGAGAWFALARAPGAADAAPSASVGSEPASSVRHAESDPNAATVHVAVSTEPEDASLFLDGLPVANPFDAELPKTDQPRAIEARLPNYASVKQELVLKYSQTVRLKLKPRGVEVAPATEETPEATEVKARSRSAQAADGPAGVRASQPTPVVQVPEPTSRPTSTAAPAPPTAAAPATLPAAAPPAPTAPQPASKTAKPSGQRSLKQPF